MIDSRRMATIYTADGNKIFIPDSDPQEIANLLRNTHPDTYTELEGSAGPVYINPQYVVSVTGP